MIGNYLRESLLLLLVGLCFSLQGQPQALLTEKSSDYEDGLELFRKGQYANAQFIFDRVASSSSAANREIRASSAYYAALSAMRLYNRDAEGRVEDFAVEFPLSPLRNRLYLEYANYRFSLKRYKDASEYYSKVEKFHLKEEELNEYTFKRAYSLMMEEEYSQAEALFFELKGKSSEYAPSARYYYAHILYTDSNYTEALSNFLPLQKDESFGALVPYYLAQIYYQLGDYNKLLEVGEDLVESATASRAPEIARLMAEAFYEKNDFSNTIKYLDLYREKGGKMSYDEHFQLGYAHYRQGNYPAAIESLNKISGGKKELRQNAYYHLGDAYLKVGDKKEAISAFRAASEITASPTIREDAYFNYAKLVYELSDPFRDAISVLNDFLSEFPASPHREEVNRYLANLYITTRDYEKAMLAIERSGLKTLEMQEVFQKVAFYRATEIFNSLKYESAIERYTEALKYPVNKTIAALSRYWIGEAHYRLNNFAEARQYFEKFRNSSGAVNMSEYNRSLYNTAYCYFKEFDFQPAALHFRNFSRDAAADDPRLSDAYLRLGDAYLMTGGYLIAADFYSSALKSNTNHPDYALFQRAECLGLAGKNERKIAELGDLIKRYPKSVYAEEAHYEMAMSSLQMEDYQNALRYFENYMTQYPQSEKIASAELQMGLIYNNTDQSARALSTYRKVVEKYPGTEESIEAVSLAKLIYARQNRIPEYLDWVENLKFVSFTQSAQDSIAFNAAFDQYSMDSCAAAIAGFNNYLSRFPKGLFSLRAHYYLASCAERTNKINLAHTSYKAIADDYPRSEYSAEALSRVADYFIQNGDDANAARYYRKLAEIAQNPAQQNKANAGIMYTSFRSDKFSEAAIYADLLINGESINAETLLDARRIAGISYYKTDNKETALQRFNNIISSNAGEVKAEAMYYKALILQEQAQYAASSEIIYKLIEDLPAYKEYKMKSLLLLAYNFWQLEDIFQADHTLDFIIKTDFSPQLTGQAQQMKEDIKRSVAEAARQKEREVKERNQPIPLDNNSGLQMIDETEETSDSTDSPR